MIFEITYQNELYYYNSNGITARGIYDALIEAHKSNDETTQKISKLCQDKRRELNVDELFNIHSNYYHNNRSTYPSAPFWNVGKWHDDYVTAKNNWEDGYNAAQTEYETAQDAIDIFRHEMTTQFANENEDVLETLERIGCTKVTIEPEFIIDISDSYNPPEVKYVTPEVVA